MDGSAPRASGSATVSCSIPAAMKVAYDSGVRNWFDPSLIRKLPVAMVPGDSLVSTISMPKGLVLHAQLRNKIEQGVGDGNPIRGHGLDLRGPAATADAFRPAFCDRRQRPISPGSSGGSSCRPWRRPRARPARVQYIRFTRRPWVGTGFRLRRAGGEHAAVRAGVRPRRGHLRGALVHGCSAPAREPLLVNLTQIGIDLDGMINSGHPGWTGWGGRQRRRKLPIVFAGILLGDDELANINRSLPKASFGEDEQTAYGDCWTGPRSSRAIPGIDAVTGSGRLRGSAGGHMNTPPSEWKEGQNTSESTAAATSVGWVAQALAEAPGCGLMEPRRVLRLCRPLDG